jgi:NAD(P)-dependent dehydrogenase (short-subunit alcohol dehydrogenase family)
MSQSTPPARVAVVTGGNRGIGLEVCRQMAQHGWQVVLTSRDEGRGREAAATLGVEWHALDVTNAESIGRLRDDMQRQYGRVDALINNAAILLDENRTVLDVEPDAIRTTLETNLLGPLMLCQAFIPMMRAQKYGRVVNVSSGSGAMDDLDWDTPAYSLSKAALNALTQLFAHAVRGENILVNAVCPGWVRTDMGGPNATRSVAQGADGIVWLAELPDGGPHGGFFRDRQPIPW